MTTSKQQSERLRKQRERQQVNRERNKLEHKPSRDDIARVLLHMLIIRSYETNQMQMLEGYCDMIVKRLKAQGFNKDASYVAFDDLVEKYTKSSWEFRRKVHLKDDQNFDEATGLG